MLDTAVPYHTVTDNSFRLQISHFSFKLKIKTGLAVYLSAMYKFSFELDY